MSIHSYFIKSIQKVLFFGFFIAGIFVTNGLNGQQNIGPYNIMLKDGWKHTNAKSDVSEHYFFEKDGMSVAIPKSPQDAPGGVNKFILDYANKLKGTDEFIEQQKQSIPAALYGKSQSARLTIKSKSTGVRRFVYLTMVDNKVYETLIEGNAINMDPAPEAIQFLSKVSVDKNAANNTYSDNAKYRTASDIEPTQFPINTADILKGGSIALDGPCYGVFGPSDYEKKEIKDAIVREITEYINRFDNTRFGKKIKLGDPEIFKAKIDEKINCLIVGKDGEKICNSRKDSKGFHDTQLKLEANIVFPFDPRTIPSGEDGNKYRQTLMHEMTHHIEWRAGIKKVSNDPTNLISERNTNYLDRIPFQMFQLKSIEERLAAGKSNIAEELVKFGDFEISLHDLEKGSAASYNPPDENLTTLTGFNASYDLIEKYYLSGDCGPKLRNLVLLYKLLYRIDQKLKVDDIIINLGQEVVADALLQYRTDINDGRAPMKVPSELMPVYTWQLPDGRVVTGNPLKYKPDKEGVFDIPVECSVTFDKETMVIAQGNLNVTVQPDGKETKIHNSSIIMAEKVNATELIDAEVLVPNSEKSKIVEYEWSPCASGPDKNKQKSKIQFTNQTDKPVEENVSVIGKDASGNTIMLISKKVTVIPVSYPAPNLIPSGKESSNGAWGVQVNGLYKERIREGHVPSKTFINLSISWISGDPNIKYDDLEKEKQKNSSLKRKMIAFDGFNGFIYESEFKKDCRGSGFVDLGYIDGGISGEGIVMKGCIGIQFSYNVYGTGVIEGEDSGFCKFEKVSHDDSEYLKSNVMEAQQKVKSFIEGIKLVPKP